MISVIIVNIFALDKEKISYLYAFIHANTYSLIAIFGNSISIAENLAFLFFQIFNRRFHRVALTSG